MVHKLILPTAIAIFTCSNLCWSAEEATTSSDSAAEKAEPSEAEDKAWDSPERLAALKVQLFLDKQGFGPGKIDARWGGFTEKAALRWNESDVGTKIAIAEDGGLDLGKIDGISFSGDLTTTYTVTEEDRSLLGALPEEPKDMAELDKLTYTSLLEVVTEKFHADPKLVRELNGLSPDQSLEVGSKVKVPNVAEPFELSEPLKLAEEQENKKESKDDDVKKEEGEKAEEVASEKESNAYAVTILREERVVEVRESGKLVHSFPVTPGANDNRSPAGDWKVANVTWMPEFRWDKSMLEDGKRSNDAYILPPGPNNPVGIVWIGLTADGIGMHGTPYPDAIGRNRSHGCIRLSNWDALKLGKILIEGIPVTIK